MEDDLLLGRGLVEVASKGVVKAEVATAAMAPTVLPTGFVATAAAIAEGVDLTLVGSDPRRMCPDAVLFLLSTLLVLCVKISSFTSQGQTFSMVLLLLKGKEQCATLQLFTTVSNNSLGNFIDMRAEVE